ncbi:MAG TPA: hypothetical protein VLX91_12275 [Candidatus Acidoferrales bacterium]|nr:hypothetical protein [Candidatus Acidoferrales bacterium]
MKTILATLLLFSTAFCQKSLNTGENLDGVKSLKATISAGTVQLTLKKVDDPSKAFRIYCSYSEDEKVPTLDYEVEGTQGTLYFANEKESVHFPWFHGDKDTAIVELANSVPVSLAMNFGVCDAHVDLGGMEIANATFSTGVCDFKLDFSTPNRIECEDLRIKTGVSSVTVKNLANAHARNVEFNGGLGSLKIDFSGKLEDDCSVHVKTGLGSVEIFIPSKINTVITAPGSFLNSVDVSGFYSQGDGEYRSNMDKGPQLRLDVDSGLGSVTIKSY